MMHHTVASQFRLWEALIAGTIPIVAEHHLYGGLAHVPLLGIRTLVLDSWWKLRDLINQVRTNQIMTSRRHAPFVRILSPLARKCR